VCNTLTSCFPGMLLTYLRMLLLLLYFGGELISLCRLRDSVRVYFVGHKIKVTHFCYDCDFDDIIKYKKFPGKFTICYQTKHHIPVPVAQWLVGRHGHIILQTPTNTELSWNGLHGECTNFPKSRNHIKVLTVRKGT